MPSAARQRLPSEMWWTGKGRSSPGNFSTSDIQASPGQYSDVVESQKFYSSRKGVPRTQRRHGNGRRSPKTADAQKGANTGAMSDPETDKNCSSFNVHGSSAGGAILSTSSKSDSGLTYSTKSDKGVFAMENSPAPDPSELPLPPLEWLRSSTPVSSTFGTFDLHTILGCTVMA